MAIGNEEQVQKVKKHSVLRKMKRQNLKVILLGVKTNT